MQERLFRCAGDIQFVDSLPTPGQVVDVRLKPFSETCNYLQYQRPLTAAHPCFFAQIRSLANNSVVTLGIAGPDINDDVHPGNWNCTVGYRSTGRCYSSHLDTANTEGHKFGVGDVFGVVVTYFGQDISTVIFLKNGQPVATRYLFEKDHSKFLPTVTLENGPIDLGLMWPEAVIGVPKYSEKNMLHWIRPPQLLYDATSNVFFSGDSSLAELVLQSPLPLSRSLAHFEVILRDVSERGEIPIIAIAACSPLIPSPTSVLLNDYFKWQPNPKYLQMHSGQRVGWGIHYNPKTRDLPDFCEEEQQVVLCFVSIDVTIVFAKMMLQPPGGWYPTVMLHSEASKVEIDMESNPRPVDNSHLDELFIKLLPEAEELINEDKRHRSVQMDMFTKSSALDVEIESMCTRVKLSREKKGIHVIQLRRPLTPDEAYFSVAVRKSGDCSVVCVGVAGNNFPLNRYPGRSIHTVGYHSRDGKMYYNDKSNGNMTGKRYGKGDTIGLEIEVFEHNMSVALFSKNGMPVGTRYLTLKDQSQFYPTVALCGNGSSVEVEIIWQNSIASPPLYSVTNIEHWCLPEGATADRATNTVHVERGHTGAEAIQAPYSLNRTYNHFEVELIEDFDEHHLPPAIALCTASPFDPTPKSNFKQDFIRFWATGEAQKVVKKGDCMGWGMLYPDDTTHHDEEQLVICYLTINRDVALTRVMFQPPGGFYPVVLLPPGVEMVRLNFGATIITKDPFTKEAIEELINEAKLMIAEEERNLAAGGDPEDWDSEQNKSKYLKPVPRASTNQAFKKLKQHLNPSPVTFNPARKKPAKMVNVVEMMMLKAAESSQEPHRHRTASADDHMMVSEMNAKRGSSKDMDDKRLTLQLNLESCAASWNNPDAPQPHVGRSQLCCIL